MTAGITGIDQFVKDLKDFAKKVEENGVLVAKDIAMHIERNVISNTQRDTGQAAGSWIIGIDEPVLYENLPVKQAENYAIPQSERNIEKNVKQSIYISSGAEHTYWLEYGNDIGMRPFMPLKRAINKAAGEVDRIIEYYKI